MSDAASDLRAAIEDATPRLRSIDEEQSAVHRAPGKWSPRELIGHLIDSASNNHQRFVRAQFQDDLVFPTYDQDEWVRAQRYADAPWAELVDLWRGFNLQLARVIEAIPADERERPRTRHNLHKIAWRTVPEDEATTLDYFLHDYVGHLRHHLGQL